MLNNGVSKTGVIIDGPPSKVWFKRGGWRCRAHKEAVGNHCCPECGLWGGQGRAGWLQRAERTPAWGLPGLGGTARRRAPSPSCRQGPLGSEAPTAPKTGAPVFLISLSRCRAEGKRQWGGLEVVRKPQKMELDSLLQRTTRLPGDQVLIRNNGTKR